MSAARPPQAGAGIPPERVDWRIASLAVLVTAVTILPALMTGALGNRLGEEIGLDLTGIGGFYGVLFGIAAIASAPTGRLVQRLGWRFGIRAAATGSGTALLAMALFPDAWWAAWWPIAGLCVLAGVAAAVSQSAANLAMVRAVPPTRYGLLFGLKHTAVPLAAMLGGIAVPAIALTIGWRQAYLAIAALALVNLLAIPRGSDHGQPAPVSRRDSGRTDSPLRLLVILAVAATLAHAGLDSLGAFVVPFAVSEGIREGLAGILLTAGSLAGLVMRLASGWLVDRRQHSGLAWIAILLITGSAGFLIMTLGGGGILVLGTLLAFAGGWGWAGLLTFVVVRSNPGAAATATGIANTGKYIGAAGGPFLVGVLADQVSFEVAWWISCALLGSAALLVAVIRMTNAGREMAAGPGGPR